MIHLYLYPYRFSLLSLKHIFIPYTPIYVVHNHSVPLTAEERESAQYVEGVSCPHCAESVTASKLQAMEERNKQISLCKQRNVKHLGYVHPGHQLLQKKTMKTACDSFSSTSID